MGRNPWTAALALVLIALQIGLAALIATLGIRWWWVLIAAWLVGAFIVHALFAVMHEATHRLVFSGPGANRALLLAANLPALVPFAIPFRHYHLLHHRAQGQLGRDPDLPAGWELRWFSGSRVGRLLWQMLFPFLSAARSVPAADRLRVDRWLGLNIALQVAAIAAIAWSLGAGALLYLAASVYFVFALHPLFGRFIQEHTVDAGAGGGETSSYYGALNRLSLNLGHHVEHHDFPAVPWNRLPRLTAIAPEAYRGRGHGSWTLLWLRFTLGASLDLGDRIARAPDLVVKRRSGHRKPAAG